LVLLTLYSKIARCPNDATNHNRLATKNSHDFYRPTNDIFLADNSSHIHSRVGTSPIILWHFHRIATIGYGSVVSYPCPCLANFFIKVSHQSQLSYKPEIHLQGRNNKSTPSKFPRKLAEWIVPVDYLLSKYKSPWQVIVDFGKGMHEVCGRILDVKVKDSG
jgi:hypothetical protein